MILSSSITRPLVAAFHSLDEGGEGKLGEGEAGARYRSPTAKT